METIKIVYDKVGNTLNVWFADPEKEAYCEETSDEIIFSKDDQGKVIGVEVLDFLPAGASADVLQIPVESKVLAGKA